MGIFLYHRKDLVDVGFPTLFFLKGKEMVQIFLVEDDSYYCNDSGDGGACVYFDFLYGGCGSMNISSCRG